MPLRKLLPALIALPLVAGCNVLGWTAAVMPPPVIEARYDPAEVPTLVWADTFDNPGADFVTSEQLARYVTRGLEEHEVVPIVGATQLDTLRTLEPTRYRKLNVAEVAAEAGAEQVLKLDVLGVRVTEQGPGNYKATATARVQLLDASGKVFYPADSYDGLTLTGQVDVGDPGSDSRRSIRVAVVRNLAGRIVDQFRSYRPEP